MSRGALEIAEAKQVRKNRPNWYFVPDPKKGSKNRSSRFEPKISWISFSRSSGPPLKKENSDLWFVNNDLYTTSTGQSTHQDSVKRILPAAHFLKQGLPAAHSLCKKSCLRRIFSHWKFLSKGHLISVSCLAYKLIGIENDLNTNTQWSQRHYL